MFRVIFQSKFRSTRSVTIYGCSWKCCAEACVEPSLNPEFRAIQPSSLFVRRSVFDSKLFKRPGPFTISESACNDGWASYLVFNNEYHWKWYMTFWRREEGLETWSFLEGHNTGKYFRVVCPSKLATQGCQRLDALWPWARSYRDWPNDDLRKQLAR